MRLIHTPLLVAAACCVLAAFAATQSNARIEQRARHLALKGPESPQELMQAKTIREAKVGKVPAGALRAAVEQKARIAGKAIAGAAGEWTEYGRGNLDDASGAFQAARVDHFTYDAANKRLFLSVGTGGVWMSTAVDGDVTTIGDLWTSVGDKLPSQIIGGLAYSAANGGTLIAAGGEGVMGSSGYLGLGSYWTSDLGQTWTRSNGFPDESLVFKVAVDESRPELVYIASNKGLFRSEDAGKNFSNVRLPTTPTCAGEEDLSTECLYTNFVTDVVVKQPGGTTGIACDAAGCPVLAGVGFRTGSTAVFQDGKPQAPGNGLYRSDTGAIDSFTKLDVSAANTLLPNGFATEDRIGRIEFGQAHGPLQDHDYVYAIVQDAVLFNGGLTGEPALDALLGNALILGFPSVFNGIYVSADFGDSWTRMADTQEIINNTSGSEIAAIGGALGSGAGIQAWYNEWLAIDPTRAVPVTGIPLRMTYGLEEVMQNVTTPLDGTVQAASPQDFELIGRYTELTSTTTHPDQHVGLYIPDGAGGVCLFVGNDGGVFKQCVGALQPMTQAGWGAGANEGFYALLPYGLAVAKDGTVWQGHQDNGSGHIEPDTREQVMDFGADGFFAEVDPDNSDVAYTESQNGGLRRTVNRGAGSTTIAPPYTRVNFANWFVMDPLDAQHMVTGAKQIFSTLNAQTVTSSTWTTVFDLGTNPVTNVNRTTSTLHIYGDAVYAGFCGDCGSVAIDTGFANGIATNVGGTLPPKKGTADGWHIATAAGLDSRFIAGIEMDEDDPKTIYVTLAGYAGNMRPPGSFGDPNAPKIGTGTVFKSTDAGETFTDISGNIPRVQAQTVLLHKSAGGEQLIVGTDIGPFISSDNRGTRWAPLGNGLPNVPVNLLRFKPKATPEEPDTIFAATFGRGIWTYEIPALIVDPAPPVVPPVINPPTVPGTPQQGGGRFGGGSTGLLLLAGLALLGGLRRRQR